jgi:2-amino-4-hydroxy-6-hydroxymethyldihydropteridine diphosphokinase
VRAVIGLGGNLGDRIANLRAAVDAIDRTPGVRVVARSSVYETAPIGPPQPAYLNAAIAIDTTLSPRALLEALLYVERALGRERRERWGPRTIDLDILTIDGITVNEPDLVVPHPRLAERAFAIVPLLDVSPNAPYVRPAPTPDDDIRRTDHTLAPRVAS